MLFQIKFDFDFEIGFLLNITSDVLSEHDHRDVQRKISHEYKVCQILMPNRYQ